MFAENIISEIDSTLERLIQNAETIKCVNIHDLDESEIDAFQKTQESLLQHLIYMDQILETKYKKIGVRDKRSVTYKIQEKAIHFEKLKKEVNHNLKLAERKNPLFVKRRFKRLIKETV